MRELRIERMSLEHIPRIMELESLCFSLPWKEDMYVYELVSNPFAYYTVGILGDQIVSFCGAWVVMDDCNITTIATDPAYRGRGFARQILVHTMEFAKQNGGSVVSLEVRVSNEPAKALYRSLGFQDGGIRKGYYADNNEDALVMWVNINE